MNLCGPKALFTTIAVIGSVGVLVPAATASTQQGLVSYTAGDNTGPYIFLLSGTRTAKPACATDNDWAIVNPSSDNAKAMFSQILTAAAAGKTVNAVGTGTCDPSSPTREKVNFINVFF